MGKKSKLGKQRKDKYYRIAKEIGYRSRAAFKILQLEKRMGIGGFLRQSRVLVDLCAAPGGWLQVAQQCMPVSSLIIGVDLVHIRPIPNVITIQADITSDNCRTAIKHELKTWLVDCVLHDGAPNIGKNWLHDAFSQAQLTVSALKLSCSLLRKGGWFVSKLFRSQDHPAVVEICKKLFKTVHLTKPQASRNESAEIFIVCFGFLKPDKLDVSMFDPKNVFGNDINSTNTGKVSKQNLSLLKKNLLHPEKVKVHAEGYSNNARMLFNKISAKQFIMSENHIELLTQINQIDICEPEIANHVSTTMEIRACCADVKVLGRRELKELLLWRKTLRPLLKRMVKLEGNVDDTFSHVPDSQKCATLMESQESESKIYQQEDFNKGDDDLKTIELRILKKQRKIDMKKKRKLRDKLELKMVIPGDQPDLGFEQDLFSLNLLKNVKGGLSNNTNIARHDQSIVCDKVQNIDDAPLIVEFTDNPTTNSELRYRASERWFSKPIFSGLEFDDDDINILEDTKEKQAHNASLKNLLPNANTVNCAENCKANFLRPNSVFNDGLKRNVNKRKLDPEELAFGESMIYSSKAKRDLIDWGYHRFTFNDDNLPDWFVEDEKRHCRKQLPVSKETVDYYRARARVINARPIKKVAEAKARKRKRSLKKFEKAKHKAEAIMDNEDMHDRQKALEIKKVYKSAKVAAQDNHKVTYVVAKKHSSNKRAVRPSGVRGRYKMVDPRMKKDNRYGKGRSKSKFNGRQK